MSETQTPEAREIQENDERARDRAQTASYDMALPDTEPLDMRALIAAQAARVLRAA